MTEYIRNGKNVKIAKVIYETIRGNAAHLSEIDDVIRDGDHGTNVNKGSLMVKERFCADMSFSESIKTISQTLVMDIGGSMGPIYGTMFSRVVRACKQKTKFAEEVFLRALQDALQGLQELAGAKEDDKTLIDTPASAIRAYEQAMQEGRSCVACLCALQQGVEAGRKHTKGPAARIGRAARLEGQSRGCLDTGATSCCITLTTMAHQVCAGILEEQQRERCRIVMRGLYPFLYIVMKAVQTDYRICMKRAGVLSYGCGTSPQQRLSVYTDREGND